MALTRKYDSIEESDWEFTPDSELRSTAVSGDRVNTNVGTTDEPVAESTSGFSHPFSHSDESLSSELARGMAFLASLWSTKMITSLEVVELISEEEPPDGSESLQ